MPASRLVHVSPQLARVLARSLITTPAQYRVSEIRLETLMVSVRDGKRLATDVYLPPRLPAPALALRTPYGRAADPVAGAALALARRGYVCICQDCRGTGDSEPDSWDYYVYELEDSYDFVEWVNQQSWFGGFLGGFGGSYVGSTQWNMALHPQISTIVPEVAGLGVRAHPVKSHMLVNAYARSIGRGDEKVPAPSAELEGRMLARTLSTGYFNEPLAQPLSAEWISHFPDLEAMSAAEARKQLWEWYCSLTAYHRAGLVKEAFGVRNVSILEAESWASLFGHEISPYAPTVPRKRLLESLHLPVLLNTGWYDRGLDDALATWNLLRIEGDESLRSRCRLFIAPSAHDMPGYHEGMTEHPELHHAHRSTTSVELLLHWYAAVREGKLESWPRVIFYLMGANEWYCAEDWPIPGARPLAVYLAEGGALCFESPRGHSSPDRYTYNPERPTPTVGGSIVSYVYPPGSVDVSEVQARPDVLVYTTEAFSRDLDVVGPLRLVVYASSTARDTDFVARLSDVFPDGRAIQLQNGILRTRYRDCGSDPELLEPGKVYRLEIDMWATANRFRAGHKLRVDISSSDFPRYERHSNRAGDGPPVPALQSIYRDRRHPSHLLLSVLRGADDA